MRTIFTQQDVEDLRRDGATPAALTEHIATFFRQLETELRNAMPRKESARSPPKKLAVTYDKVPPD